MKRLALLLSLVPFAALAQPTTWAIDPAHSQATFSVRHMVISTVRGEFQKTSGTVHLDEADLPHSTVEATIDAASINTHVEARDNHLRSPDFFDVAKFPNITFKSTRVEKAGEGKLKVTGDLTLHGITRPVVLEVEGPTAAIKDGKGLRRGLTARTTINRQDYGLRWNKAVEAGPIAGDEVKIEIDAEMVAPEGKQDTN